MIRIIAGPCQHESLEQSMEIAKHCKAVCDKYNVGTRNGTMGPVEYIFKASFDKANRTSLNGERGPGLVPTAHSFVDIKQEIPGLKTLTDVHSVEQIRTIRDQFNYCIDVLQIPAFLCRQTDIIKEACRTDKIVNIKKGQFLAPWDVAGILSKTKDAKEVWITERGTSFGYNNLVVDFNGLQYMLDNYSVPIVFDATHSCQKPGGSGESSGGNRAWVPGLTRAASAMGVSNFFLEVHPDPDNALSDGPNMLKLEDFDRVVEKIVECNYDRR